MAALPTVLEILRKTETFLREKGIEDCKLDAQYILAKGLGLQRMDLFLQFDRPLTDAELAPVRDMLRRRAKREPLQHILGDAPFRHLHLKSDRRALIPRPETEELVDLALAELKALQAAGVEHPRVLDIGTGTGAIALSIAKEFPAAEVHASDVSAEALSLARENAESTGFQDQVQFHQSDLFMDFPDGLSFQGIVSNPPYIPSSHVDTLEPEVLLHDPRLALDGGQDGLDVVNRLLEQAPARLAAGGFLLLEVSHQQTAVVLAAAAATGAFGPGKAYKDLQGALRFVGLRRI